MTGRTIRTAARSWRAPSVALLLAALASPAAGQGQGAAVTHSPATVLFPTPTPFDFDAGAVDHGGVTVDVDVQGNSRWRLLIRTQDGNLGGYGKPLSDLLVRGEGATAWVPVSTADQVVLEGNGDASVVVYFRLRLSWALDEPDTYGARIVFSAS